MSLPIYTKVLDDTKLSNFEIAPIQQAITLARLQNGDVLLVKDVKDKQVYAVNLSKAFNTQFVDAIDAYNRHNLLNSSNKELLTITKYSWDQFVQPVKESYPHIAAGTNFIAHADEVGLEHKPFLFPKLSHTTPWNADVKKATRLDYEIELCAVTLKQHSKNSPSALGYFICGDFTDRWKLISKINTNLPMGQTGFPQAKGGETRLPIGALLVIPSNEEFYKEFDLKLYVNNDLRQSTSASLMVWSPQTILDNALADCETPYYNDNEVISISDCQSIPSRTILLTGTPEGVLFKVATILNPLSYLAVGDTVVSYGKYLGFMKNNIASND